jgi:hypothetical protein
MDSRLREIEQWLDEAKSDLKDNGQEAYLRKLYLLDAEIRAVIRENDPLPGVDRASLVHKPVRVINLPLAVAGLAAVAVFGSALIMNQGNLRIPGLSRITPFTGELADVPDTSGSELSMVSLNRFPQGEELVSLDELQGAGNGEQFTSLDRGQLFASLSSENFSDGVNPSQPAESTGPVENIGLLLASGSQAHSAPGNSSNFSDIKLRNSANRGQYLPDGGAYSVDVALPALTPLPQGPIDGTRFNYYPVPGDSSGVDQATNPAWSATDSNGRSSEVQLASNTPGIKASGSKAEKKGLDGAALARKLDEVLRKQESKDS